MLGNDAGILGEFELKAEEEVSEEEQWFVDVYEQFILARAYADVISWLRDAKGPNSATMLLQARHLHMAALSQLRYLGQRAFMLWGVNIPLPKGIKQSE